MVRVNGKIRAREVRVVTEDGRQLGVLSLAEAIRLAQSRGVDLVEVAPNATPPVCRIVDFGKYRYEQSKREKEARKHQHATKMKEVQLRPGIDPHDRQTKLNHAIEFLCDEMKVKLSLRFRGREMVHQEIGTQVVDKFIEDLAPYGHPDAEPKLAGKNINVILSPLPRNKRAKMPQNLVRTGPPPPERPADDHEPDETEDMEIEEPVRAEKPPPPNGERQGNGRPGEFVNDPFSALDSATADR